MSNVPHSPLCMCQVCQDEALASEIRVDAEALRTVTAERDELRKQLEQYQAALAGQDRNLLRQEKVFGESRRKLEVERDALRARIENAPCATVFLGACGDLSITTAELNDAIVGKCVRLVIDDE